MNAFDPAENATRTGGLERLAAFVPSAGRAYAANRNTDFGSEDRHNVSILSPYIRHRLVLEAEVLEAVLARFAPTTAEKFIQEVFWRSYFKGWLEQRPTVWTAYRCRVEQLARELEQEGPLSQRYRQAISGQTGIACFDAWALELSMTGYLHNHARMWFASIWIFTLELPWELGADFLYRHLLDGDPASNTLSWRWVAGLHTKGKTYLARPGNIRTYTAGRFDPGDQLAKDAPPLRETETHDLRPIPPAHSSCEELPAILLVTEDDCTIESLIRRGGIRGGLALLATKDRSPMRLGDSARSFAAAAVRDAADRAQDYFDCPFDQPDETVDWTSAIQRVCAAAKVSTVVTAYAPVGPVAERLAHCRQALERYGIQLVQIRRQWDDGVWPHATKGFFSLKAKIPSILEARQRQQLELMF